MMQDIINEKSETVLKLMAAKIAEDEELEYKEFENGAPDELPAYVDAVFEEVFNTFAAEEKKRRRQHILKHICKVAVIILAIVSVSFAGLLVSVEAFRYRVFGFLSSQEDQYTLVIPYEVSDEYELPQSWHGFYYPEYLPDDYHLVGADKSGGKSVLLNFMDSRQHIVEIKQISLNSSEFLLDNEGDDSGEIEVNGERCYWNKNGEILILFWKRDEVAFTLIADSLPLEEVQKIAESINYKK